MTAQIQPIPSSLSPQAIIEDLQSLCSADLVQLNQVILHNIEQRVPLITDIAKHLILAGGKRIRPLLAFACHRALGVDPSLKMVELAAAIEFIHNATLLHDDVIDNSVLRRSRPTANALWGNRASILVGDFIFAKSFELMLGANEKRVLPILANVFQTITQGEVLQLSYLQTFDLSEDILFQIMSSKTAALFAASCEIGAALLDVSCENQQHLHDFGYNLGIMYQIIDDLLDYTGTTEQLGKSVGDDLREGKVTLPLFMIYSTVSPKDQAVLQDIITRCASEEEDLSTVFNMMKTSDALDRCYAYAKDYAKKAEHALSFLPASLAKDSLICLVHSLVGRIA